MNALFPRDNSSNSDIIWGNIEGEEEWSIQIVTRVIRKRTTPSTKAPGPDGIKAAVWKMVSNEILETLRHIFNCCLVDGEFPRRWKNANLVLIPEPNKPGAPEPKLPKVRPICLLDEIGKAFERILANRISKWQEEHPEHGLAENQFGFRKQIYL